MKLNKCFTIPPGLEAPSVVPFSKVRVRFVICAAETFLFGIRGVRTAARKNTARANSATRFPLTLMPA